MNKETKLLVANRFPYFILLSIFLIFIFLRFWEIGERNPFGWDQVDNAWAAKNIIVEHKFPLTGMVAKGNTGFYIGPAYYYLISIFYFIFNLDPIASGIFAGLTGVLFFGALFFVIKNLFSFQTALFAVFIYTVSFSSINFDRVQWPVNFIPFVSLMVFYCLYKTIMGEIKYLVPLGLVLGFSFHVHFTSIFYPIIILFCLPLIPKTAQLLKYGLLSLLSFLIWFVPYFIFEIQNKGNQTRNLTSYLETYYHGLHLVRVRQLIGDAFIQFDALLEQLSYWVVIKPLKYLLLPIFMIIHLGLKPNREKLVFCYMLSLWFLVPWLVFSTYKGEISDYYFSISRPMAVLIISYLLSRLWQTKRIILQGALVLILINYAIVNFNYFLKSSTRGLSFYKTLVKEEIKQGQKIEFKEGAPESYIYYLYTRK